MILSIIREGFLRAMMGICKQVLEWVSPKPPLPSTSSSLRAGLSIFQSATTSSFLTLKDTPESSTELAYAFGGGLQGGIRSSRELGDPPAQYLLTISEILRGNHLRYHDVRANCYTCLQRVLSRWQVDRLMMWRQQEAFCAKLEQHLPECPLELLTLKSRARLLMWRAEGTIKAGESHILAPRKISGVRDSMDEFAVEIFRDSQVSVTKRSHLRLWYFHLCSPSSWLRSHCM